MCIRDSNRVEEHKANLVDDFTTIKDFALNSKTQEAILNWINKTKDVTFIQLNNGIIDCRFKNNWIN